MASMKKIGLLGGMSWESTVTYYQVVNRVIKEQLGGLHSAECILYSVDFHEIELCQAAGDWDKSASILTKAALALEKAGADFIVICTNTMHKVAEQVQESLNIPLLHIAELTADELLEKSLKKVALLGTIYTMEQDFYKAKVQARGIEVIIPEKQDRLLINSIIFEELCLGIAKEDSRKKLLNIVTQLGQAGAEGVILGCTELGILLKQQDTTIPLFDTAIIHATRAALYALDK